VKVVGKAGDDLKEKLKPNPISESNAQGLKKVQELLSEAGCNVFLVE
jgi:hypothetical protein